MVLAALGRGTSFLGVVITMWMQIRTAPAMMGRVMSLCALAGVGPAPLSLTAAGVLAQVDVTLLFILAGGSMGSVSLAIAVSRTVPQFE
jgi:hypothetical protein